MTDELSKTEVIDQLRALGVEKGAVLLAHISFRSVRPVDGGVLGLIEALRDAVGPDGTLVMPSFSEDDDEPFDPTRTPAWASLGVVADTFWRLPGVVRSNHFGACAALGPAALRITSDPLPLPLPPICHESPIGRVHELDGQVLLIGVGHEADTTLHLAEFVAGVPYRISKYCTVLQGGRPVRIDFEENDHCCERFALADSWLRAAALQAEGRVGHARARLARARDIVRTAVTYLAQDPLIFLHAPHAGCVECNLARTSLLR
jgi:aminoglycoside 3-N-acetyltransferase